MIETAAGRLPVLAAISEIAGQVTVPLAAHLLRSSSGGRGILLGGSPGVPPAHVVILGAGTVGSAAARDRGGDRRARHRPRHRPAKSCATCWITCRNVATALADRDSVAAAVAVGRRGDRRGAGGRQPARRTWSRARMVESMKPGAVIIDVSIDQGGCVETSRPTTSPSRPSYTTA